MSIRWLGVVLVFLAQWPMTALAQDLNVQVVERKTARGIELIADLVNCTEATITLTAELKNMTSSVAFPLTVDMRGQTHAVLATLTVPDKSIPWHYQWRYSWQGGRRLEKPPAHVPPYQLPYRHGPFKLIQGPGGSYSHHPGSNHENAYDFAMPAGTPVYAAREGKVVAIRQDSTEGGARESMKEESNYVTLMHDDGTFADYVHLSAGAVRVELGQRVSTRTVLGLSGNTGFSSEPHLHFAVHYPMDGASRKTLPVQFIDFGGKTVSVAEGKTY